jgi:hypothetical protein
MKLLYKKINHKMKNLPNDKRTAQTRRDGVDVWGQEGQQEDGKICCLQLFCHYWATKRSITL